MDGVSIGDDVEMLYEFDWGDHSRTSDELGDLQEAGFDATLDDIVDVARADPDCEVNIIGFSDK